MIAITTSHRNPRASIEFRPEPAALSVVRSLPGREYHPRRKCWSIPKHLVPVAVAAFSQSGRVISVDGEIQIPAGVNPFPILRASLSEHQWMAVARVLRDELETDARLYKMLKAAYQVDHQARAS